MATKRAASANQDVLRSHAPAPERAVEWSGPTRRKQTRRAVRERSRTGKRRTPLQPGCAIESTDALRSQLTARVIGQDHAIDALVSSWARLLSGLRDPDRPLLTALLMGPTGVGKTETARALAAALFGSESALHRINCEEYAHGHEVAKLLGSPPGYIGADIEPLLSQRRIDRPHWDMRQAAATEEGTKTEPPLIEQVHDPNNRLHSILLFDEVEKAHPTLWNALLGILEEGQVTLGNNTTTDLTRSVILMTTNVGSREMGAAIGRVPLGFAASEGPAPDSPPLVEIAEAAARQVFPVEFLNRFDETLVFRPLGGAELDLIFDKFLGAVNERTLERAGVPLLIKASEEAKSLVIEAGTDAVLGARPLRRAIERMIVDPVSRLLACGQIGAGDVVEVEREKGTLRFYRLPRSSDKIVA